MRCFHRLYFLFWRSTLFILIFTIGTILCTASFGEKTFLLHVLYVTHMLSVVLIRLSDAYGSFKVPHNSLRKAILSVAFLHTVNPLLMTCHIKNTVVMSVHVPLCLMVHVAHLSYVIYIFHDIGYSDMTHSFILVLLNCLEAATNILIMVHPTIYWRVALATEAVCPFVLVFKLKRPVQGRIHLEGKKNQLLCPTSLSHFYKGISNCKVSICKVVLKMPKNHC